MLPYALKIGDVVLTHGKRTIYHVTIDRIGKKYAYGTSESGKRFKVDKIYTGWATSAYTIYHYA